MPWKENFNLILISLAFLFYFLSYNMILNVQKCLLKFSGVDAKNKPSSELRYAYYYTTYTIMLIIAPYVTNKLGPRMTMISAFVLQLISSIMIMFNKWMVYFGKVVNGCSTSLMFVAQGRYLSQNSTKVTLTRNLGIYFAIGNLYMFIGNTYVFYRFDQEVFDTEDLKEFYILTTCLCLLAIFLVIVPKISINNKPVKQSFVQSVFVIHHFFIEKEGWKSTMLFIYTGLQITNYSNIYGNALSLTLSFHWHPLRIFAVSSLLTGIGGTLGAMIFAIYSKELVCKRMLIFVVIGLSVHLMATLFTCLNLPNTALEKPTNDKAIIKSNSFLALFCSFLFGIGDAFFFIVIYRFLAEEYEDCITEAHGVFRFFQSLASGTEHYSAKYFGLYGTLSAMSIVGIMSTISFYFVESKILKKYVQKLNANKNIPAD